MEGMFPGSSSSGSLIKPKEKLREEAVKVEIEAEITKR